MVKNNSYLELVDISYNIGSKKIISDISIKLGKGKLVGIIGPNGAGKSTLLKLVTKIIKPSNGTINLNSKDISLIKNKQYNKKVAYLAQNINFNFPFKVLEIVLMGRYPYINGLNCESLGDIAIANKALEYVDMAYSNERNIMTLSGGEQQRVSLARIIAQESEFLFLDEPISNLDINHQLIILELLKNLRSQNKGIYVVLHDIKLAYRFCDELIIINNGQLVDHGIPETVLSENILSSIFKVRSEAHSEKSKNRFLDFLEPHN